MIKYEFGKNKTFTVLSEEYFDILNPISNNQYTNKSLIYRLNKALTNTSSSHKLFLEEFAKNNYKLLRDLISAPPHKLELIISKTHNILSKLKLQSLYIKKGKQIKLTRLGEEVYSIFDYDSFRKGEQCDWLLEQLDIPICPYCNRNLTVSVEDRIRPVRHLLDIDHYFCKAMYPFLSLSFYNLIPSCHICNATYKGYQQFSTKTHTHPYLDDFHSLFKFEAIITDAKLMTFGIDIVKRKGTKAKDALKCTKIIEDLSLIQVYNHQIYKKEVSRIEKVMRSYPAELINYLSNYNIAGVKIFDGANTLSDESLDFGERHNIVLNESDIRYTMMGKLSYDIAAPLRKLSEV